MVRVEIMAVTIRPEGHGNACGALQLVSQRWFVVELVDRDDCRFVLWDGANRDDAVRQARLAAMDWAVPVSVPPAPPSGPS